MARLNRIANTERLIIALRDLDSDYLVRLESYQKLVDKLLEFKKNLACRHEVLFAIADLIEEAMEKKE